MGEEHKNKKYFIIFIITCIVIIAVTVVYGKIVYSKFGENSDKFGDMFGGLSAVFTGLAFAGVIISILMQMYELELTRTELTKSAEAQNKTQQALNKQLKSMELTTKINILESYKNSQSDEDKKWTANAIIARTTKEYFKLEEYKDLVVPNIKVDQGPNIKANTTDTYVLTLNNSGSSCKLKLAILSPNDNNIRIQRMIPEDLGQGRTRYPSVPSNYIFKRDSKMLLESIMPNLNYIEIEMIMICEIVPYVYRQILKIEKKDRRLIHTLSAQEEMPSMAIS